ncbi:MAG: hypothetical protein GY745_20275 [Actinomycetia bacterium]|nr:hypothetical protein [Actinomycetes bacterium]MCP4087359.1 hypothetical protein [Actinomycetes bacterium]
MTAGFMNWSGLVANAATHWGKDHNLAAAEFEYPDSGDELWGVQSRFDPEGRFLNHRFRHVSGR